MLKFPERRQFFFSIRPSIHINSYYYSVSSFSPFVVRRFGWLGKRVFCFLAEGGSVLFESLLFCLHTDIFLLFLRPCKITLHFCETLSANVRLAAVVSIERSRRKRAAREKTAENPSQCVRRLLTILQKEVKYIYIYTVSIMRRP